MSIWSSLICCWLLWSMVVESVVLLAASERPTFAELSDLRGTALSLNLLAIPESLTKTHESDPTLEITRIISSSQNSLHHSRSFTPHRCGDHCRTSLVDWHFRESAPSCCVLGASEGESCLHPSSLIFTKEFQTAVTAVHSNSSFMQLCDCTTVHHHPFSVQPELKG